MLIKIFYNRDITTILSIIISSQQIMRRKLEKILKVIKMMLNLIISIYTNSKISFGILLPTHVIVKYLS